MSHYSAYTTSGPTGEIGVRGSVGPTGPTGPTGSGIIGPVGPTGIGVSFADGTADTSIYFQLDDGLEIQYDNVSVRGNPNIAGTIFVQNNGNGVDLVAGVSGGSISFKSLKFSNDYAITRQENDIIASIDTTSGGTSSVNAGSDNQLTFMSGVSLASGATFTHYGTGGSIPEKNFISLTLKDYTSIVKGPTGEKAEAYDGSLYTFIHSNRTTLHDSNIFLIDQSKFQLQENDGSLTWKTLYNGPTFNSEYIGSGFGTGPTYSNALYATFIIKTPNIDMSDERTTIEFGYIDTGQFDSTTLEKDSFNMLNCMSVSNGITWDCFSVGAGYTYSYSDLYSPGTCCYEGDCYDYMNMEGCINLGGTYKENTICDGIICGSEVRGACCTNDICLETTKTECDKFIGSWFSEQECSQVPCAPVCSDIGIGACCFPFGQCNDRLPREYCELFNGVYQGDGVYCWEVDCCEETNARGACCYGTTCLFVSANECYNIGGLYYGSDTTCQDVQCCDNSLATGMCCCDDGQTCVDNVTEAYCDWPTCIWEEGAECIKDCEGYEPPNITDCERQAIVIDFEIDPAIVNNDTNTKLYLPMMIESGVTLPYEITTNEPNQPSPYAKKILSAEFKDVGYSGGAGIPLDSVDIKIEGINSDNEEQTYSLFDGTTPLEDHIVEIGDLYAMKNADDEPYKEIIIYMNTREGFDEGLYGVFIEGKLIINIDCGAILTSCTEDSECLPFNYAYCCDGVCSNECGDQLELP